MSQVLARVLAGGDRRAEGRALDAARPTPGTLDPFRLRYSPLVPD
ncbi:MAG: hypothetical protein ACFCVG_00910 [Kineosporiaceae bacterium]